MAKTSGHIQITIKMPYPFQEPPVSPKAPNEDLKDMDVLCTFKIKVESQNLDHVTTTLPLDHFTTGPLYHFSTFPLDH